jgi:hypothetical protein
MERCGKLMMLKGGMRFAFPPYGPFICLVLIHKLAEVDHLAVYCDA